ncbi:hypothetical protein E2562_031955 [Oryza meyeriana var. granulata]|uniref:Uncharacterized protein n=1 Tax=Oryza meyeriana var. granulata TaxID=110450 RepID=A0A6G1ERZ5_9ORYZ|nr:hypothetical protein E2562_031955 [Oryza meyeriana var. granulata]
MQRFMQMHEGVMDNMHDGQAKGIVHLIGLFHHWIIESRGRARTSDADHTEAEASVQLQLNKQLQTLCTVDSRC